MQPTLEKAFAWIKHPLERFLKTDVDYLGRGSFWTVSGTIISMVVALVLSVIYARYLTKEFYGTYTYIQNLIGIALAFTLPALGTGVPYAAARGALGTLRQFINIRLLLSLIATLILAGMSVYFLVTDNTAVGIALAIAAVIAPLYETRSAFATYWNARKAFKRRVQYTTIVRVATGVLLALTALLIYFWQPPLSIGIPLFIGVYLVSYTGLEWYFSWKALKRIPRDAPVEKQTLKNGIHYALMSLPPSLAYRLDIPILFAFLDPVAVAIYTFAITPVRQLKGALKSVSALVPPKIANIPFANLKGTLPKKIFKSSALLIIPVALYILLAPFIFEYLYPRYLDSVIFTQIFALSLIIYPFMVFSRALVNAEKVSALYVEKIGGAAVRIILLFVLTAQYGILGAILANVVSMYLIALTQYLLFSFSKPELAQEVQVDR